LTDYIDSLAVEIQELESVSTEDMTAEQQEILDNKLAQFALACDDPRASCPEDQKQSGESGESSGDTNWMLILGIVGGLIFLAVGIGLMMRGSGREENFFESEKAWSANTLPIHDAVANSMYGGAAPIFQQQMPQPVAPVPQPVVAPLPLPVVPVGPPLPPGGLPAGWTMEQWQYYGQQYLDRLQQ
jgi:hypothetical protein